MKRPLKLVILGMMGRCPFGGQTWLYLGWLRGFHRLGHEVWYVEDDTVWPYDPERNATTDDPSFAVRHVAGSIERAGLPLRWAYRAAYRRGECFGLDAGGLCELYRTCDALLNVCGATELREEHLAAPLRIYVETDPVTSELRLANGDEKTRAAFARHHLIFTYGENYGAPDCGVPLGGLSYLRTRQPIDLDLWPETFAPEARFFTTIGNYRQEGEDVAYRGEIYRWSKHHEWEKFMDLPRRTRQPFEVALGVREGADRERLLAHGWRLVPPIPFTLDVFGAYREFVRRSRAEFTVAKDQNVRLRSGWFSERDACYLASGKPVVAQGTGFENILPVGEGLFAVRTPEEALAAIDAINADYRRHCRAARAIAAEFFEAGAVAARLLAAAGLG